MKLWYFTLPDTHVFFPHKSYTLHMGVSENSGTPKSSIFIIHYKPSILVAHLYFWKHPYVDIYIYVCVSVYFFSGRGWWRFPIHPYSIGPSTGALWFARKYLGFFTSTAIRVRSGKGPSHKEKVGPKIWSLYSDLTRPIYPPNGGRT